MDDLGSEPGAPAARARRWHVLSRPRVAIPAAALLACGIAAAVFFGGRGNGEPTSPSPSASPSETPSASPSATPSPVVSVDANGRALPGFVSVDPSLPEALPLPPGIWAETGPGWVLATYRPSVTTTDDNGEVVSSTTTRQVIYLVSPTGERYQVLELDVARPIAVDSWSPGETTAVVHACAAWGCYFGTGVAEELNLETGAATPIAVPFAGGGVIFTAPDGSRLWADSSARYEGHLYREHGGAFVALDPEWRMTGDPWRLASTVSADGNSVALSYDDPTGNYVGRAGVLSLSTGTVITYTPPAAGSRCFPWGWEGTTTLRVRCLVGVDNVEHYYFVETASGVFAEIAAPDFFAFPSVFHDFVVGTNTWVGVYNGDGSLDDYEPTVGLDSGGTVSEVTLLDAAGALLEDIWAREVVGSIVYAEGQHESSDVQGVRTVVALDVASGRQVVLLPAPPGGPTAAAQPDFPYITVTGLTSWVVGR